MSNLSTDALETISTMVLELTALRQNECKNLIIENYAPELFAALIRAYLQESA